MIDLGKRNFLAGATLGAALMAGGAALAQTQGDYIPPTRPKVRHRTAKTTKMFKAPGDYPNALAVAPEGLWIAQQKLAGAKAVKEHAPSQTGREEVWLVDWNGKLLNTLTSDSQDTSGLAYGDGCVWVGANIGPEGVFQVDMNNKPISHHQMPLGTTSDGGGCHGAKWHEGKLWVVANRLRGLVRMDPKTWAPEVMVPIYNETDETKRWHDMTFDDEGNIWLVTGNDSTSFATGKPGVAKYDGKTGELLELVAFPPGACDPHGLEFHDGALIGVDAGYHPGWPIHDSPSSGYVFRIDVI